jgi:hypothetical protein
MRTIRSPRHYRTGEQSIALALGNGLYRSSLLAPISFLELNSTNTYSQKLEGAVPNG